MEKLMVDDAGGASTEGRLFVGRTAEMARFDQWLSARSAPRVLLQITGSRGVGKSALLRAFAHRARQLGYRTILGKLPERDQDLDALLGVPARGDGPVVVLCDACERRPDLEMLLTERLLPRTGMDTRFVLAGGRSLARDRWDEPDQCSAIIVPIHLDSLSPDQAAAYLAQSGIAADCAEVALDAVGGYPLGLARVADLARDWRGACTQAPDWPGIRRSLVRHWLSEIEDPRLTRVVEAAALVHRFDHDLLQALLGDLAVDRFDALLRLSFVRPADGALTVHPDLRRVADPDLRWRRPVRYALLRRRAREHYSHRFSQVSLTEREALVSDHLYLCGHPVIDRLFFMREVPWRIRVVSGTAGDHPAVHRLWTQWITRNFGLDPPPEIEHTELQRLLDYPGTRLHLARDHAGNWLGFSAILPVCAESLELLQGSQVAANLIQVCWRQSELTALPASAEATTVFLLHHLAWSDDDPGPTLAALLQDAVGVLWRGGIYLASAAHPALQGLLDALGFRRVPASVNAVHDPTHPVEGYELNLSATGFAAWIDACGGQARLPSPPRPGELERELQNALAHWRDDAWLSRSPLAQLAVGASAGPEIRRPDALRRVVQEAMLQAAAEPREQERLALRAVELAYLIGTTSHQAVALTLGVSRATFYRLLPRGITLLAQRVRRVLETSPRI